MVTRVHKLAQKLNLPVQVVRSELLDMERDGLATRIDGDEWDLTDKGEQWAEDIINDNQRTDQQST